MRDNATDQVPSSLESVNVIWTKVDLLVGSLTVDSTRLGSALEIIYSTRMLVGVKYDGK